MGDESMIESLPERCRVRLLIGMVAQEGIRKLEHVSLLNLLDATGRVEVRYLLNKPPCHAKMYIWRGEQPYAFVGSANYSQKAFFGGNRECLAEVNPLGVGQFFDLLWEEAVEARDCPDRFLSVILPSTQASEEGELIVRAQDGLPSVDLPLTSRGEGKEVPMSSGLNWSFRTRYVRTDRNQAYLSVPSKVAREGFFPPRSEFFDVVTDDGETFVCTIAQDGDKAIHTPLKNSLFGVYFRKRLGVPLGERVTIHDLERYGRKDVTITKLEDGLYHLDFRSHVTRLLLGR